MCIYTHIHTSEDSGLDQQLPMLPNSYPLPLALATALIVYWLHSPTELNSTEQRLYFAHCYMLNLNSAWQVVKA